MSEDFLARAALARQQDRGVAGLQVLDELEQTGHRRGARDHSGEHRRRGGADRHVILCRTDDDDVGNAGIADPTGIGDKRSSTAGHEARRSVANTNSGAPSFAKLAVLESIAQHPARPEQLGAEKFRDGPAGQLPGILLPDQPRQRRRRVNDAKLRVETDQHAVKRIEDRADGDQRRHAIFAFAPECLFRHPPDVRPAMNFDR